MRSGIPSLYMPATTGNTPVMTEATGATMPMRPIESAWYSAAMPKAPAIPATAPHNNVERGGNGSAVIHANKSMSSKPQACAPATTRKTLARLVAMPPAKSPPPQTAAALRLRPAPVKVPESIGFEEDATYCLLYTSDAADEEDRRARLSH